MVTQSSLFGTTENLATPPHDASDCRLLERLGLWDTSQCCQKQCCHAPDKGRTHAFWPLLMRRSNTSWEEWPQSIEEQRQQHRYTVEADARGYHFLYCANLTVCCAVRACAWDTLDIMRRMAALPPLLCCIEDTTPRGIVCRVCGKTEQYEELGMECAVFPVAQTWAEHWAAQQRDEQLLKTMDQIYRRNGWQIYSWHEWPAPDALPGCHGHRRSAFICGTCDANPATIIQR